MEFTVLAFYRRLIYDPSPLTETDLANHLMLTESAEYQRWFVEDSDAACFLTLGVYAALNLHIDHCLQKAQTFLKNAEVFQNPRTMGRWTGDQVIKDRMWTPALKLAKVRYRNPYQTRHTYASMMPMAGENPLWVAKQMGHTDAALTLKRYGRWIVSDMPDAGNKAVAAWSQLGHTQAVND